MSSSFLPKFLGGAIYIDKLRTSVILKSYQKRSIILWGLITVKKLSYVLVSVLVIIYIYIIIFILRLLDTLL